VTKRPRTCKNLTIYSASTQ